MDERLVTPETRRRIEELMEEIEAGSISYDEALERAVSEYLPIYQKLEHELRASMAHPLEGLIFSHKDGG